MTRSRTARRSLMLLSLIALPFVAGRITSGQARSFEAAGSIPGPADRIRANGTHLYVATDKTLTIYDVSNPSAPKRAGGYGFPEQIWGFRVDGGRLYAAIGHTGLGILDVSNPAAPSLITIVK